KRVDAKDVFAQFDYDFLDPSRLVEYRGCSYLLKRQYAAALQEFDSAVELSPSKAWNYFHRGEAHTGLKNYSQAAADITKAIELDPPTKEWYWWYKRLAAAHFHLKNYPEVLSALTKAVELKPEDVSSLRWIPPGDVARCGDRALRVGLIELAGRAIQLTQE